MRTPTIRGNGNFPAFNFARLIEIASFAGGKSERNQLTYSHLSSGAFLNSFPEQFKLGKHRKTNFNFKERKVY